MSKIENIIFITRESMRQAGARIRCYSFADKLRARGFNTEVISFADHFQLGAGIQESSNTFSKKVQANYKVFMHLCTRKKSCIILQRVHYHIVGPLLAQCLFRHLLILDIDDWEMNEDIERSKTAKGIAFLARHARYCIAASRYIASFLAFYTHRIAYVPSACDSKRFFPVHFGQKGDDTREFIFAWVGTFYRRDDVENIMFAIECVKELLGSQLGKIKLEIVGEGIYTEEVTAFIRAQGTDRIAYRGWIASEEIPAYLATIDAGLMPLIQDTKFNYSKSPTKLFEYMAMGKPVITNRRGEALEIIEDGKDGLLAEGKDEYRNKMEEVATSRQRCISLGQNARLKIERFYNLEKSVDTLEEMLTGIGVKKNR